jgi:hypothetical protein
VLRFCAGPLSTPASRLFRQHGSIDAVCFGQLAGPLAETPGLAGIDPCKADHVLGQTRFKKPVVNASGFKNHPRYPSLTRPKSKEHDTPWIQVSSATFDLKAASSSAMASSGVFHRRVLRGRWFISRAMSFSSVWLISLRSVPLGKNGRELSVGILAF